MSPTTPVPLPLTVPHRPFEPAHGLLARAIDHNVPGAMAIFRRVLGAKDGRLITSIPADEIAAFCSLADIASLERASPMVSGQRVSILGEMIRNTDYSVLKRKWCPDCLRQDAWHRAWWDIRSITGCPEHHCVLVDACQCGRDVTWLNRPGIAFCSCGLELAATRARNLEGRDVAFERYVISRLSGAQRPRDCWLDPLPLFEVEEFVRRLGQFVLDPFEVRGFMGNQDSIRAVMSAGFQAVTDFPVTLEETMERLRRDKGTHLKQPHFLHSTDFRSWLVEYEPASVSGAISGFFHHHARRQNSFYDRDELPYAWSRIEHAAELCGMPGPEFHRMLLALDAWPQNRDHSTYLRIEPFFLGWLVRNVRYGKELKEVAEELDVSKPDAKSLVDAGLIKPFVRRGHGVREFFPPGEAAELIGRLRSQVILRSGEIEVGQPLPMACRERGVSLAKAVTGILQGRIPVAAYARNNKGLNTITLGPSKRLL